MEYKKHYDKLIETRRDRNLDPNEYYERHHIVMRSMGGSDDPSNLVYLTAREHFLAHWLLWKIHDNRKAALAFSMMSRGNDEIKSSRAYESVRKALSDSQRGSNNCWFGRKQTPEHRAKLREVHVGRKLSEESKERIRASKKGKKRSEECKRKMAEASRGNSHARGPHKISEDGRRRMSEAHKGKIRPHSPEAIENMRKSKIEWWKRKKENATLLSIQRTQ